MFSVLDQSSHTVGAMPMGASFRGSCTRRRSSSSLRASAASTKTTAPVESRRPPTLLAGSVVSAALRYCRGLRRRSSAGVSEDDAITSAAHTDVPMSAMNANAIHPGLMRRCPTIDGARRSFKKGTAKWKSDSDVCRGLSAPARRCDGPSPDPCGSQSRSSRRRIERSVLRRHARPSALLSGGREG